MLLDSVFSTTPLYMLSLYKVPVKIRKKMDSIRCQFIWQDTSTKKKFALVSWKWVCMPK
jgi:hypothetical protein